MDKWYVELIALLKGKCTLCSLGQAGAAFVHPSVYSMLKTVFAVLRLSEIPHPQ